MKKVKKNAQSRRTFPTLAFSNLNLVIKNLDKNNVEYSFNKSEKIITVQEPGLNYIELTNSELSTNLSIKKHNIFCEILSIASVRELLEGAWRSGAEKIVAGPARKGGA